MESGDTRRDRYHHGALKESLIAGARQLLAEKGPDNFSLSELARRVGVSAAAPYRHFENREALLGAVAVWGYEQLLQRLGGSLKPGASPVEQLQLFGVCYLRFATDHPELFEIMFSGRYSDHAGAAQRASFEPMIDYVEQAQRAGTLPAGIPSYEVARFLWAAAHGLTVLHLNEGFQSLGIDDTPEGLTASAWEVLLGEVGPPRSGIMHE
ncbi:TetR/AcrR family transcriptional regulator [Streptomyces sp. NPDC046984]|uniref:TetR/AcrR family transcriptional regulator n=1 Tax=Streptomyces sp. NPDC046984 TaxID=3155138 RepID=UPI00340240E7